MSRPPQQEQRFHRRRLTLRSTGRHTAGRAWASFHSGPSPSCRAAPVTSNVRRHGRTTLRYRANSWPVLARSQGSEAKAISTGFNRGLGLGLRSVGRIARAVCQACVSCSLHGHRLDGHACGAPCDRCSYYCRRSKAWVQSLALCACLLRSGVLRWSNWHAIASLVRQHPLEIESRKNDA